MGAELFSGGYDYTDPNNYSRFENVWNTGFHFNRQGSLQEVYHKQILIPFGETLPFGPLTEPMSRLIRNISYFAKGDDFPLFKTDKGHTFINAICYEVLVESYIRKYLNSVSPIKPDFLLNLTNDSWYGKSNEPYQHKFLSHWRAVENQIPMVRSTNTGLTSILYPDGTESETIDWYVEDVLDVKLYLDEKPISLFQKYGHLNLFIIWVLLIFFSAIYWRAKNLK